MLMINILASDEILGMRDSIRPEEPHGVRLARSFHIAKNFSKDFSGEYGDGGVLVLDQEKIIHNHKIIPYRDVTTSYEGDIVPRDRESEEVVLVDRLKPLSKYLTGIHIPQIHFDQARSEFIEYWPGYTFPATKHWSDDDWAKALHNLEHHPLRKS